jgi:hypothetical protein
MKNGEINHRMDPAGEKSSPQHEERQILLGSMRVGCAAVVCHACVGRAALRDAMVEVNEHMKCLVATAGRLTLRSGRSSPRRYRLKAASQVVGEWMTSS